MAKSSSKTILAIGVVAVVGFLAYKLWPSLAKALKGSGGSGGTGGVAGASSYQPYNPYNPNGNNQQAGMPAFQANMGLGGNNPGGKGGNYITPSSYTPTGVSAATYASLSAPSARVENLDGTGTETMAQYAKEYNALENSPAPGSAGFNADSYGASLNEQPSLGSGSFSNWFDSLFGVGPTVDSGSGLPDGSIISGSDVSNLTAWDQSLYGSDYSSVDASNDIASLASGADLSGYSDSSSYDSSMSDIDSLASGGDLSGGDSGDGSSGS
jgi:hypothetical protein